MNPVIVVAIFAVVQSLFGIGLLVFGTPTLLLSGHSFSETLSILLPASITVSLLQVWNARVPDAAFTRLFVCWCLLPLSAALAAVLMLDLTARLNLFVALLLLVFVILRLSPAVRSKAGNWVTRHERIWLVTMGVVHGLSNLGGGMLMIFAASRFRQKEDIRRLVAFCYAWFAGMQLVVLALLSPDVFSWTQLAYAALAGSAFLLVGQRVFRWVSAPAFDWLLTLFAAVYAGLLGLRSAGYL
jgi:uncharacterized protein